MNYKRLFVPNAMVFITVLTNDRKPILLKNIQYLKDAFNITKQKFVFDIVAIVVNPDHFHMIIKPENISDYPKIVGCIKSYFTRFSKIKHTQNNNRESNVWQRRYWEHTIISELDLYKHIDYIHYNPMKHYNVAPKDWEYSSFNRFVKGGYYESNWCNYKDKYGISKMNLE